MARAPMVLVARRWLVERDESRVVYICNECGRRHERNLGVCRRWARHEKGGKLVAVAPIHERS